MEYRWCIAALLPALLMVSLCPTSVATSPGHAASGSDGLLDSVGSEYVDDQGPKVPHMAFVAAVKEAAVDIPASDGDDANRLLLITLANEWAMQNTLPKLLASLSKLEHATGSDSREMKRMDSMLVVVVVGASKALKACKDLQQQGYLHHCTFESKATKAHRIHAAVTLHSHPEEFHSLSYVKVISLLNALTVGHSVLWVDADVVVLRNPVPYLVKLGADVAAGVQTCSGSSSSSNGRRLAGWASGSVDVAGDDKPGLHRARIVQWPRLSQERVLDQEPVLDQGQLLGQSLQASRGLQQASDSRVPSAPGRRLQAEAREAASSSPRSEVQFPALSTELLYLKSSAPMVRCMYSWVTSMAGDHGGAQKGIAWEQDHFVRVFERCAAALNLRVEGLPPQQFVPLCPDSCGCSAGGTADRRLAKEDGMGVDAELVAGSRDVDTGTGHPYDNSRRQLIAAAQGKGLAALNQYHADQSNEGGAIDEPLFRASDDDRLSTWGGQLTDEISANVDGSSSSAQRRRASSKPATVDGESVEASASDDPVLACSKQAMKGWYTVQLACFTKAEQKVPIMDQILAGACQ